VPDINIHRPLAIPHRLPSFGYRYPPQWPLHPSLHHKERRRVRRSHLDRTSLRWLIPHAPVEVGEPPVVLIIPRQNRNDIHLKPPAEPAPQATPATPSPPPPTAVSPRPPPPPLPESPRSSQDSQIAALRYPVSPCPVARAPPRPPLPRTDLPPRSLPLLLHRLIPQPWFNPPFDNPPKLAHKNSG